MKRPLLSLSAVLGLLLCAATAANPVTTENVTARLVAEHPAAAPASRVALALVLEMRPGWHTYWRNPGDSGEPPSIRWELPPGVSVGPIRWPRPDLIRVGPLVNYGYSGTAVHLVELSVPPAWPVGRPVEITAHAAWLVCEEECVPESAVLRLTLPVGPGMGPGDPALADLFADARGRLPSAFPGQASLTGGGDGFLRLTVERAPLPANVLTARFFPWSWGLVEHAADQPLQLTADRLSLQLARGAQDVGGETGGVLLVQTAGGTSAYRLEPRLTPAPGSAGGAGTAEALSAPLAFGFALLGGLLLNLMPCVFPVLAMKAMSLAGRGALGRRERALQGLAYTGGVLAFFALVAALLLALRSAGSAVGWGYQLQYPPFVVLMAYVFFTLGLSLAGAITIGSRLMGLGAVGPSKGRGGAFVTGALAALVAAPCTAPFMGAALGYAVTLSWPLAISVILTLGLGLALPYLLLALVPGSERVLPRPGPWMENLKQLLAFPMFATAAWLVWVLSVQTGPSGVAAVLTGLIAMTLGLWAWERSRHVRGRWRAAGRLTAVAGLSAALALGAGLGDGEPGRADAEAAVRSGDLSPATFSADELARARAQGRPVLVNVTAAWCITCLVNERVALSSKAVADAFAASKLLYLKADWTSRDPGITEYLAAFGRNGVPLYVHYPPGGEPEVLPQMLTESIVLDAVGGSELGIR